MTTATTTDFDALTKKIDAIIAGEAVPPAPATPTKKTFTKEQFAAYCEEQIAAAIADANAETKKARLEALKTATATAKASFESGTTTDFVPYVDPLQQQPTTHAAPTPTELPTLPDSNVQYDPTVQKANVAKFVTLCKSLAVELKKGDASPLVVELKKSDDETAKLMVAKAGPATAMLEQVATMFGVDTTDADWMSDISWNVSDAVYALKQAAKMEQLMTTLAGTLGKAVEAAQKAATEKAASKVAKSAAEWPMDLAAGEKPKGKGIATTKAGAGEPHDFSPKG